VTGITNNEESSAIPGEYAMIRQALGEKWDAQMSSYQRV
jgi:hypothetical protein